MINGQLAEIEMEYVKHYLHLGSISDWFGQAMM